EHALDPAYAKKLGVNLDDLLVSQPSSGEEALRICETLVRSNALDVIVVDSVAARSEEHTSELQSLAYLVCRLLLEKKKNIQNTITLIAQDENRVLEHLQISIGTSPRFLEICNLLIYLHQEYHKVYL